MAPIRTLVATACFCLLSACDTAPTRVAATTAATPAAPSTVAAGSTPAANDNVNAVAWMQTSVEFRLIAAQTWRAALLQLDRGLKTPGWDALTADDRGNPAAGLPPAIIVDIDETVLDNSPYQARMIRDGHDYGEPSWSQWVNEAAARPVPGALEFARAASARGITVFYLSNRADALGPPTLANLRKDGFPLKDDGQLLGPGTVVAGCPGKGSDKGCRRQLVGRNYRVLMQIGDQLGDFVSIATNSPIGREQAVRPYLGWVGERWFVLPNPSYGSWEPALFNNDWAQPGAERRQLKLKALRY